MIEAKRVVKRPAYSDPERFVSVTVQLRNGSKEKFDTATFRVSMRYGKAGEEADDFYPISDGYDGLNGNVLPGRLATGRYAFKVPAGKLPITVEVSPGYKTDDSGEFSEYGSAFFEGSIS